MDQVLVQKGLNTTVIKAAGGVLIIDGVASIFLSTDQRTISTLGRILRTGIGAGLLLFG